MLKRIIEELDGKPVPLEYLLENNLAVSLARQSEALQSPRLAYLFALKVKGADVAICQEVACKDVEYAWLFALYVKGANKDVCRAVCKGTEWEF